MLTTLFEKEEFLNDIIISSYSNLILGCMIKKYENVNAFFEEMEKVLEALEEHLFAWYSSHTRAMSVYFIDITKLYMLRLVQENLKISWEKRETLKGRLLELLLIAARHSDYWKYAKNKADNILHWN